VPRRWHTRKLGRTWRHYYLLQCYLCSGCPQNPPRVETNSMLHKTECLQVSSELSFEDRYTIAKIKIGLFSNLNLLTLFSNQRHFPFRFFFFSLCPHIYTWCRNVAVSTPATCYWKVESDMFPWLSSVRPAECEDDTNHDFQIFRNQSLLSLWNASCWVLSLRSFIQGIRPGPRPFEHIRNKLIFMVRSC
jgi:hypothetical protein